MQARALILGLVLPLLATAQEKPAVELKEFAPKDGGFSVLLPDTPKDQTRKERGPDGKDVTIHVYVVDQKTTAYTVSYVIDPNVEKSPGDADSRLQRVRKGLEASLKGKLLSEEKITLEEKYPGLEFLLELAEARVYRYRVYLVKDRFYQVAVLGSKDAVRSKESDQVLNSFKLVK